MIADFINTPQQYHRVLRRAAPFVFMLLCFIVLVTFAAPIYADAADGDDATLSSELNPDNKSLMGSLAQECVDTGRCTLCDALQLFAVVARWMLGFAGSIALLFFIYGGFLFLTSGGVEAKVTSGKTALTNATVGLALVLGSWLIVNTIIVLATGTAFKKDAAGINFNKLTPWSTIECGPTGGRADEK